MPGELKGHRFVDSLSLPTEKWKESYALLLLRALGVTSKGGARCHMLPDPAALDILL